MAWPAHVGDLRLYRHRAAAFRDGIAEREQGPV